MGEGGTVLTGLFFLIIFERFPAPSPRLYSLTVSRKFLSHKEGLQGPLAPEQGCVGRVPNSALGPKIPQREEKLNSPSVGSRGREARQAWIGRGLILAPSPGPEAKATL